MADVGMLLVVARMEAQRAAVLMTAIARRVSNGVRLSAWRNWRG